MIIDDARTIGDIAEGVLLEVTQEAVAMFKDKLEKKHLIFTAELYESFKYHVLRNAETISAEIEFRDYGRYKDMKQLSAHHPPNYAIETWVEKIGVEKFSKIPGYENSGKVPSESIAIRRIANAIAFSMSRVPTTRGYTGTWYNSTKMEMINMAKKRMRWQTSAWISMQVTKAIESGTFGGE